jgi:hypothetical protein
MSAVARIWAIAKMTLVEARRRKVFTILLLFGAALMSSIMFFPSVEEMDSRLRLIEIWSLRASALFTAIVGLFLAGFSLPTDFEQKRIYMIVTKPVSKSFVFLGRYAGYVLLLAAFIGSMGLITVLFLRTVSLFSGEKFKLAAYPRIVPDQLNHSGGEWVKIGNDTCVAVKFGQDKDAAPRHLVWLFDGLRRSSFADQVDVQSRLIFGAENDAYRASGAVRVILRNPAGATHEVRLQMNTNEERRFQFPADIIGGDGRLAIEFHAADSDGIIAGAPEWLMLHEKSIPFELAFARGLLLVLLQSTIVLSITLMASTFLSAPLSILLGILLYLVGSMYGYIRDGTREIDHSLAEIRLAKDKKAQPPEHLPAGVLWFSNVMSKAVLYVVPDFAHFDYSVWLLKDQVVSWRELAAAGAKALPPILILMVLGTLLMIFKDFDR